MSEDQNYLFIGNKKNDIYIKAIGYITANISFPMREHLYKNILNFSSQVNVYIDLSDVKYMDSTFMGLLVGIEKRIKQAFGTHLHLINVCDEALRFLKNMRIDSFLTLENTDIPDGICFNLFDDSVEITEDDKTEIVLQAHENLSGICAQNKDKFKFLQEMLQKQLNNKKK